MHPIIPLKVETRDTYWWALLRKRSWKKQEMASKCGVESKYTRPRVTRPMAEDPNVSTRRISANLGISHGCAYHVFSPLVKNGLVKLGQLSSKPKKVNMFIPYY